MVAPKMQFEPATNAWGALLDAWHAQPQVAFLGKTANEWRALTRRELGLPVDRPIIATGHEAVLWHPGILAKYIALDAWAQHCGAACVHLVVDQHVGGFGAIDVPVHGSNGELNVETLSLGRVAPDVPMGWHPPLAGDADLQREPALPSVREGLARILKLVCDNRGMPNAAAQMGRVLDALLEPWVRPLPGVTASALMTTSLARAIVHAMVESPQEVVEHYNRAIAQVPEAGMTPLAVTGDDVELPVWRIDEQGRRQRGFVGDARAWLDDPTAFPLPPRALTMTALLRLGVCDVFIHGFGGARYDRAMEGWMESWLGATPQPMVMISATLRLPFAAEGEATLDERVEQQRYRRVWHDPALAQDEKDITRLNTRTSELKSHMLREIEAAPRSSVERRNRYFAMHEQLEAMRRARAGAIAAARERLARAQRQQREREITQRRTWPFAFFPDAMIASMAERVSTSVREGCGPERANPRAAGATSARS